MDSLMSLELRNLLQEGLELSLPSSLAFDHPTVEALSLALRAELVPTAPPAAEAPARLELDEDLDALLMDVRNMDSSAVEALLREGGR
jgi:hypothetical protein